MSTTTIPSSSLGQVLRGAAVATKSPDSYVHAISRWLQLHEVVERQDSPDIIKLPTDATHTFSEWNAIFESQQECWEEGTRHLLQVVLAVALWREMSRRHLELDSAALDIVWGLLYEAIVGAEGTLLQFTVSRSAQGFLAVPLCSLLVDGKIDELWRFHTWMPDGQRGNHEKFSIHAHQPFGQSWTLLGTGTDETFDVDTPVDKSLATHATYECVYTSSDGQQNGSGYQTHQISSTLRSSGRFLRVAAGDVLPHSRDMTYSVPGGAYHQSVVAPCRLHATLFVFDAHRGYDDSAAVLGPKEGGENVQLRDPAGITPVALAEITNATRKWEQIHDIVFEGEYDHPTVTAYYRLFRGLALLRAGRREDAMQFLSPEDGLTPVHAFASEPTSKHRDYIRQLIEAGTDVAAVDKAGRTALDYARANGDRETIMVLESALQRQ